jgi:hypothetical protein
VGEPPVPPSLQIFLSANRVSSETSFVLYCPKLYAKRVLLLQETNWPFCEISLFTKLLVLHVSFFQYETKQLDFACSTPCFAKFLTFELLKSTSPIAEPILRNQYCGTNTECQGSGSRSQCCGAAAPGENIDAGPAPAPPALAPILLFTKPNFLKSVFRICFHYIWIRILIQPSLTNADLDPIPDPYPNPGLK